MNTKEVIASLIGTFIGAFIVRRLRRRAGNMKIVLDAGHGGNDPGAVGGNLFEKDVNIQVVKKLETKLKAAGAEVYLTRKEDEYITLPERVRMAESVKADLFLSVHANSYSSSSAHGAEVLYKQPNSKRLAEILAPLVAQAGGIHNRGIKHRTDLYLFNNQSRPTVLVELAFISNPQERTMLFNPTYQNRVAEAIVKGIIQWWEYR